MEGAQVHERWPSATLNFTGRGVRGWTVSRPALSAQRSSIRLRENGFLRSDNHVPTPDELICSALRGQRPSWPWPANDKLARDALCRQAELHGVEALLHNHLNSLDWPTPLVERLRTAA